MDKVLIAMSGGVDSSVAAYLMKKEYDCIGITMHLFDNEDVGISREKTCCSLDDVEDARAVALRLDMPYYVVNFTGEFREKVICPFIDAYEHGETPNPCIECNRYLKFERLYQSARENGCSHVVTGHYVRIEEKNGRYLLKKAVDETKDQSYVLYSMTQEQLAHTYFPLGEYRKTQIREIAEEQGLINARKHDSQDICFVPDGDYASVIRKQTGKEYAHGHFVDVEGNILGEHKGIIHYTIGQRKGLGLSLKEPMYVMEIRPETNEVVLGRNDDLFTDTLIADRFNWIAYDAPMNPVRVKARIRYKHKEQWATATVLEDGRVKVVFDEPQRAITAGQAVVLYEEDVVVGGGTICKKE